MTAPQSSPTPGVENSPTDQETCRICLCDNAQEPLITPCSCRGSIGKVHLSCLECWLSQAERETCELCHHRFKTATVFRYSRLSSVRVWLRIPRHWNRIRLEVILTTSLTCSMLVLSLTSLMAIHYFRMQTTAEVNSNAMVGLVGFLVLTMLILYTFTLYAIFVEECRLWYKWWKRTCSVKVILPTNQQKEELRSSRETHQD